MARVALVNKAGVSVGAIEDVCEAANLPLGKIRLIVGDAQLHPRFQGFTVPRALIKHSLNIAGFTAELEHDWECGVTIGTYWASRQAEFPVYFAFLLGHEFGHATTVLTNLVVTIYEDLLEQSIPYIGGRDYRWDEFPHEAAYDQFGLAIAAELFGREAVEEEFNRMLGAGLEVDEPRLRTILTIEPRTDLRDLRSELAAFALPYKEQLLKLWQQRRARIKYLDYLPSLDCLWERPGSPEERALDDNRDA